MTAGRAQAAALALGLAMLGACEGERSETPGAKPAPRLDARAASSSTDAGSAPTGTSAPTGAAAPTVAPLEIPIADRCASPCLLLAEHRFAAISEGAYCELCKGVKARACELEWPPIADEPSCDDWDRWRSCLLAAHGYRFRSARVRATYRRKRWYDARRKVRPSALGAVARANLGYLETRARACRAALAARAGRVIARLRGDLDGDRRRQRAVVTDTEVRVGRERLAHGLDPSDAMAAIEASLIDIDASDRAVEILVALHRGDDAASRYVVVYVAGEPERKRRGRPGPLAASSMIETFGTVEATGDGALEVRERTCGQIREQRWSYDGGVLKKSADSSEGSYDANRCD